MNKATMCGFGGAFLTSLAVQFLGTGQRGIKQTRNQVGKWMESLISIMYILEACTFSG